MKLERHPLKPAILLLLLLGGWWLLRVGRDPVS